MAERSLNPGGDDFPVDRGLLRTLLSNVDEMVLTCRPDGTITFVSPATAHLLGFEPGVGEGRNLLEFLHPDEHEVIAEALHRWTDRRGTPQGEAHQILAADGTWVRLHYDILVGPEAEPFGGFIVTLRPPEHRDATRRELVHRLHNEDRLVQLASIFLRRGVDEFEDGLREALDVLAGMEWVTRVSVWVVDGEVVVPRAVWAAQANAPTLGLPDDLPLHDLPFMRRMQAGEEVHIRSAAHLPDEWAVERARLEQSGVQSLLAVPMTLEHTFMGFVVAEVTLSDRGFDVTQVTTMRSAAAILASAFGRNATETELLRRARTDLLTGLGNQWAYLDALAVAQQHMVDGRSRGCAVVLLDLDHFTLVNDALGFEAADGVLAAVADRLRHAVDPDVALCRLHGDEFVLVVPDVRKPDDVTAQVSRLQRALAPPFEAQGRPLLLTASAGIVMVTDTAAAGPELMSRVDLVMQQARTLGGERIGVEDEALHLQVAARLVRQNELRAALDEDRFEPWFQGEWDLADNTLVGAEALARWHHPREGLVEASGFIDLAEQCGIIAELGDRMLRQACVVAARWPSPMVLRVNLSARQLQEVDVRALIASALAESGLAPERLCLELTETALLVDPAHAVGVLDALRADGVGLAVDDFGTGYSSLLYLKRLPVTSVKIDRSFVSGLPANPDDRAIVAAVVQLSSLLGIDVVAEGVETAQQRDALLELGCRRAQGYLLSRPEPTDAFAARVAALGS